MMISISEKRTVRVEGSSGAVAVLRTGLLLRRARCADTNSSFHKSLRLHVLNYRFSVGSCGVSALQVRSQIPSMRLYESP